MNQDTNELKKDEQAMELKCPNCKASIPYNPTVGKWKCEYCGSEFTLEEIQKGNSNISVKEENTTAPPKDEYSNYISYKCESCGAEIIADEETSATFCVYCGNTAILKSKLSGEFAPDKIIPFQSTKEDAIDKFKGLSKGRPLMPKSFNNPQNIEKIKGVYVPFWLYDLNLSGDVQMKNEIIKRWSVGRTHYTKTSIYDVVRGGTMNFDNVPADASSKFDNDIMNSIEPFNFSELRPYNHSYLSGFYAEKYDVSGDEMLNEVTSRATNSAIDTLKRHNTGTYSTVKVIGNNLKYKELSRNYALLPVWMVNVKYNNKMYTFAMNGQTGEFIGNIPIDIKKLIIYSLLIFTICFSIFMVISYIGYISGG